MKNLTKRFGLTEREVERILIQSTKPKLKRIKVREKESITFAAIGDTHLCSKKEALSELHTFYDLLEGRGVKIVLHAGDLLDGQGVYHGQEYEVHTFGADNQVSYAVENYPRRKGIRTYFINGNHSYAYFKKTGLDTGAMIAKERNDMVYLGAFKGEIEVGNEKIWLIHPDGANPYALSYRSQKFVEQITSGDKPKIILFGHLHTMYHFDYRNIYVFGVGCFQGQTSFILRKGINPVIGGWIITIYMRGDKKRTITRIVPEFIKLKY